jgi:FtsH-binding integral membrane protein
MITFLLILLVIGIVLFTHFVVTYLIENDLKIIGVAMGFVGVIAAIIVVYFIMSNITEFVMQQLDIFYND